VLENGTEVLKAHVESTRDLVQTLAEQSRKQREAFQTVARGSYNTFVDFLTAPFSYFQQTLESVESAAWRKGETEQHVTREGVAAQKATRQAQTR
jgi:FixJ family two-component response regulator